MELTSGAVEANDVKLKEDVVKSVQGLWSFLEANNQGIM